MLPNPNPNPNPNWEALYFVNHLAAHAKSLQVGQILLPDLLPDIDTCLTEEEEEQCTAVWPLPTSLRPLWLLLTLNPWPG